MSEEAKKEERRIYHIETYGDNQGRMIKKAIDVDDGFVQYSGIGFIQTITQDANGVQRPGPKQPVEFPISGGKSAPVTDIFDRWDNSFKKYMEEEEEKQRKAQSGIVTANKLPSSLQNRAGGNGGLQI